MNVHVSDSFTFPRTGKTLSNRTVLAAMTNKQSHPDGSLSDDEIRWLTRRAAGGFGLITTAATHVSPDGQGWENEFGVHNDKFLPGLEKLSNSIHKHDSLLVAQLFHGGARSPQALTGVEPLSASKIPSDVSTSGFTRAATIDDIYRIINDFTLAAKRCELAGFDGVELHGAHGYLLSQFLGKESNSRNDNYGGNLLGKARLLIEIIRSIKKAVGDSFLVGVRISPEIQSLGIELKDSLMVSDMLTKEGIDFLHISVWDYTAQSREYAEDKRTLTEWFTSEVENLPPVISTGSVWSQKDALAVLAQGADLVGVGRAGIAHPDWGKYCGDIGYDPQRPPFNKAYLRSVALSDPFIQYMRRWKGFVDKS